MAVKVARVGELDIDGDRARLPIGAGLRRNTVSRDTVGRAAVGRAAVGRAAVRRVHLVAP